MNIESIEVRKNRKLYMIRRPDKKSIIIWIMFYFPLDMNASLNALLSKILLKGSYNYRNSRTISKVLYENYGATFGSDINLKGEMYTLSFFSDFVNPIPGFVDRSVVSNICSIIRDVVYNPLLENGLFNKRYFDIEKENLINDIKNLINDKNSYAFNRCVEIMCKGEPYSIDKLGKVEWIEEISRSSLTQRYFDIMKNFPVNIYIMGNISDELLNNIKGFFPENDVRTVEKSVSVTSVENIKEIDEYFEVSQSIYSFGFRTGTNLNSTDYPALVLLNNILGGGANSLLFKEIREKRSLCYSISSSIEKYKELLFVNCGIDRKNKTLVKEKVIETMGQIKAGKITDSELNNALINVKHNLTKLTDDPFYYISYIQGLSIYNSSYSIEEFSNMLNNVTSEDIIAVSKKIKLDTIYFLGSRE